LSIKPPYNLKTTGNPDVCAAHMAPTDPAGKAKCQQYIQKGLVALIWDYGQGSYCFPGTEELCTTVDINGFRVYQYAGSVLFPQDVYDVSVKTQTAAFVPFPQKPDCNSDDPVQQNLCLFQMDTCYTVRANEGSIESLDSNTVCVGDPAEVTGTKTILLLPSNIGVKVAMDSNVNLAVENLGDYKNNHIVVGYLMWNEDDIFAWRFKYGRSMFNLDEVKGKSILSARFRYQMFGSKFEYKSNSGETYQGTQPCARAVGVARDPFWLGVSKYTVDYDTLVAPAPTSANLDVTDVVKAWAQGQTNYGFVLDGSPDPIPGWQYVFCESMYAKSSLQITYFPNK
jgi:hypothetical protein